MWPPALWNISLAYTFIVETPVRRTRTMRQLRRKKGKKYFLVVHSSFNLVKMPPSTWSRSTDSWIWKTLKFNIRQIL